MSILNQLLTFVIASACFGFAFYIMDVTLMEMQGLDLFFHK